MTVEQLEAEWDEAKQQSFYTDSTQRVRDYIDDYYIVRIMAEKEKAAL